MKIIIRRSVYITLLFCGAVALSLGRGAAAAANPPPFDVDFLHCGQMACANVYQGEGVSHPQLVVQITRKGAGLGHPTYTYIYDFPPDDSGTISFYIGAHLAQRIGGENAVSLDSQDLAELVPDGHVLAEGVHLALFAPDTFDLGLWPSNTVLEQLVDDAMGDIPNEIFDWDAENGFIPQGGGDRIPGDPSTTPPGSPTDNLLPADSCLAQPHTCFGGPGGGLGLAAPGLRPQPEPIFLITPIPERTQQMLASARTAVQGINLGGLAQLADPGRTAPVAQMCSAANLENTQTLTECRDRCDSCDQMWEQSQNVDWALTCGSAVAAGGLALIPETLGTSYVAGLAFSVLGGASGCGWLATTFTASHRAALYQSCRHHCDFIFTGQYPGQWSDTE